MWKLVMSLVTTLSIGIVQFWKILISELLKVNSRTKAGVGTMKNGGEGKQPALTFDDGETSEQSVFWNLFSIISRKAIRGSSRNND